MAADPSAHAFAGEHDRSVMPGAKRGERCPMGFDELGQRVRPLSARERIGIVERVDRADRLQEPREAPHSRMRGGSAGAGREQKGGTGHGPSVYRLRAAPSARPNPSAIRELAPADRCGLSVGARVLAAFPYAQGRSSMMEINIPEVSGRGGEGVRPLRARPRRQRCRRARHPVLAEPADPALRRDREPLWL